MTENNEKKGVDISQFTDSEEAETAGESNPAQQNEMGYEELLNTLQEADPVLAMITAKIFDIGNIAADLIVRVERLEHHVGYLLSQDKGVRTEMEKAKMALSNSEDQNGEAGKQPPPERPAGSEVSDPEPVKKSDGD